MINVLITGSSGFVGQNLIRYLPAEHFNICTLNRNNTQSTGNVGRGFTWKDLTGGNFNFIDTVIHLAGKAHDVKGTSNANEYFEVNTDLTKRLFDTFLKSTATTFIYMSSVKAAADIVDTILYEDVVANPQTSYGRSKRKAEEYLLAHNLPKDKRLIILRPCMIHGPGNKGNLNLLYKFVNKGIPYPLAGFENKRSFLSVSNLNFVLEKFIKDFSIPGGIYNVADDIPLSTNRVIGIIAGARQSKPRLWKINSGIINFLAKTGDIFHLPLNSKRLKKLTESYVVSNNKIKEALNISHLPLSSEEGLKLTIKSFHSS